jgi:hypothetical protein
MDTNLIFLLISIVISVFVRNRNNEVIETVNRNECNGFTVTDPAAFQLRENTSYREFQFEVPVRY